MKRFFYGLLFLCISGTVFGYSPAQGLWWNPNESGRGYTIDVQNNIMVVTAYVYDSGKKATWFTAAGNYNNANNTYSGTIYADTGGQCWGCAYSSPTETIFGTLSISFTSPSTATMNFPGGSTQIQRYIYGYANQTDYFLGEWSFTLYTSGLLGTQWIVFNSHYTGSDGTIYASGQEDGVSGTIALGAYYPSGNYYIVAVADSSDYTYQYLFRIGDDRRMLGLGTIFRTGQTPPNPSNPAAGSRLLFQSELSSAALGSKPTGSLMMTSSSNGPDVESLARSMSELSRQYIQLNGADLNAQ